MTSDLGEFRLTSSNSPCGLIWRQVHTWLEASVAIKVHEVSSVGDCFLGSFQFFYWWMGRKKEQGMGRRRTKLEFLNPIRMSCCHPSLGKCTLIDQTARVGGCKLIQGVWAASGEFL